MATIKARLEKLERAAVVAPGVRGLRRFNQVAGLDCYIEVTDCVFDYRQALAGGDGIMPPFVKRWTLAEINALEAEGWQTFIITWADGDDWRTPDQVQTIGRTDD